LQELSTPAKGEKAENVDDAEEDADDSASQSLARLYQKATRAGLRVAKANQDEILCWYKYAEGFENRVRDIRSQDSTVTDPTARTVKSLNIFRGSQKQICVRKPRKQGIYIRCLLE